MTYRETVFAIPFDTDVRTVLGDIAKLTDLSDLHLDTLEFDEDCAYIVGGYMDEEWEWIERFCERSVIRPDPERLPDPYDDGEGEE